MTNTANLNHFFDRSEQILSTIKSGNRMSLETSGDLKTHLEAITDKYSSVLVEAPENPVKGDKWFDGKSTWTYDTDAQAWLPDFVTPNKSYFSFAATVTANTATDLTQAIEIQDNDFYKVTIDFVSATGAWQAFFTVKEDNGAKVWNGTSWVGQDTEVDYHSFSGDTDSVAHLVFRPISKSSEADHSKFKLVITSTTSSDYRGTAVIDHLATGALTDGAVYDTTTGGGGGSGDGFQPDRVIVIDTTLTEAVPGKAYPTFAAAKTYMEANPSLKFCVELPAGDFGANDPITLSGQWTIYGNNTVITTPLVSTITVQGGIAPRYLINDCTISAGFETVELRTQAGYVLSPLYTLHNCTVTQLENAADNPSTYPRLSMILMEGGVLQIPSCSDNSLKLCNLLASGVTVMGFVANQGSYYFYNSTILGSVTARNSTYDDVCHVAYDNCNFVSIGQGYSIYGTVIKNSIFDQGITRIESSLDMIMSNVDIATHPSGSGSSADVTISLSRDLYLRNTIIQNLHELSGDLHVYSDAISTQVTAARVINRPIVYSTDGGATRENMSNDPTGATHYGLCKNFTEVNLNPTNYMWFPMPS